MSKYEWEEVKRLAADFQRAQLSSTTQRLSERNCIEIITKLIRLKLLDVIFSIDGKSYITSNYLIKEIKDELYIHGGRVNMIDIAKSLNVDFNVINSLTPDILKEDSNVRLIHGQLINHMYIIHVAEEINERLQQHGIINVSELARTFDLPGDFLHSIIKENNGRIISNMKQDKQDTQIYYTETFLNQNKSVVRGALLAITKPTLISTVISHCGVKEIIFFSLIDSLIECKQIPGVITERCGSICTYIPQIYLKIQSEWINNFYKQNGYLEYDTLCRVGINDPKSFIAKSIQSVENLLYLRNCVIGQQLIDQIEASIEDVVNSPSWTNILTVLPTVIDSEDAEIILRNIISKNRKLSNIHIFNQTYAVSNFFLNYIYSAINNKIVSENANNVVNSGRYKQYIIDLKMNNSVNDNAKRELTRKEERKKRPNSGKTDGTQGREIKMKSVKKKYGQKNVHRNFSDEEDYKTSNVCTDLELVSVDEIKNIVENGESFQDEEFDYSKFVEELVQHFYPLINKAAIDLAHSLYEDQLRMMNNSKRKMNVELQDSIILIYHDLKQYHKGIKEFRDEDSEVMLSKYLLKVTGTQLVNTCFTFVSDENEGITSVEDRLKVISSIEDKNLKEKFNNLHKSLNSSSIEVFISSVEDVISSLNIMIRKMDKKKEKNLLETHKQALVEKLKETDNPPLILHLVTLILFHTVTQNMLNASGRFVSNILYFLSTRLPADSVSLLQRYHASVLKLFKMNEDDEEYLKVLDELKEATAPIKELVFS